jgi:hypothetical protein
VAGGPEPPILKNKVLMVMSEFTVAVLTKVIHLNHCPAVTSKCYK